MIGCESEGEVQVSRVFQVDSGGRTKSCNFLKTKIAGVKALEYRSRKCELEWQECI